MAMPVKLEHRDSMLRAFEGSKEKNGFSAVARAEEHASHMKLLENALKVGAPLLMPSHAYATLMPSQLSPRLPSRAAGCEESARGAVSSIGGHPAAGACALPTHSGTPWIAISRHAHVCRRRRRPLRRVPVEEGRGGWSGRWVRGSALRRTVKPLAGVLRLAGGTLARQVGLAPPHAPLTALNRWSCWPGRSSGCRCWWLARSRNGRCTRPDVSSSKLQVRTAATVGGRARAC